MKSLDSIFQERTVTIHLTKNQVAVILSSAVTGVSFGTSKFLLDTYDFQDDVTALMAVIPGLICLFVLLKLPPRYFLYVGLATVIVFLPWHFQNPALIGEYANGKYLNTLPYQLWQQVVLISVFSIIALALFGWFKQDRKIPQIIQVEAK